MQIKKYTFDSEPVLMDFHDFRECTFRRCRLVYCGYSPVQFEGCRFEDCRWEFNGPAAATLQLLASLKHRGGEMGKMIFNQAMAIVNTPPQAGQAPAQGAPSQAPTAAPAPIPPVPPTPPAAG